MVAGKEVGKGGVLVVEGLTWGVGVEKGAGSR